MPDITQNALTNSDPFPDLLKRIVDAGFVLVASSGNFADRTDDLRYLDTATPRKHGGTNSQLNMIVVGYAKWNGDKNDYSNYEYKNGDTDILSLYSMGTDTLCADYDEYSYQRMGGGSSEATAQVAGMAAYFLSKKYPLIDVRKGPDTAATMKRFLIDLAKDKKGLWPDNVPRAALDHEIKCQLAGAATAVKPALVPETAGDVPAFPTIRDISNGLTIVQSNLVSKSWNDTIRSDLETNEYKPARV